MTAIVRRTASDRIKVKNLLIHNTSVSHKPYLAPLFEGKRVKLSAGKYAYTVNGYEVYTIRKEKTGRWVVSCKIKFNDGESNQNTDTTNTLKEAIARIDNEVYHKHTR